MEEERFCLLRDAAGHWYCIPWGRRDEFGRLLGKIEAGQDTEMDWAAWEKSFAPRMLEGHVSWYSFTGWRREG